MRIRTVKPEFWSHPIMGRLPDDVRLLALALLSFADDFGYFAADPLLVRAACSPFNEDSMRTHGALNQLEKVGWIQTFQHPEMGRIGKICNFEKHQRICRPTPSKLAKYWQVPGSNDTHQTLIESSLSPHASLNDDSLLEQGTGNREQGTGDALLSEAERQSLDASAKVFDRFWKAYPIKVGKAEARRAFDRLKKRSQLPDIDVLIAAVDRAIASDQWQSEGGKYIPHPATWLNRGGWEDEHRGQGSMPPRLFGPEKKETAALTFPANFSPQEPGWDWIAAAKDLYGERLGGWRWAEVPDSARREILQKKPDTPKGTAHEWAADPVA